MKHRPIIDGVKGRPHCLIGKIVGTISVRKPASLHSARATTGKVVPISHVRRMLDELPPSTHGAILRVAKAYALPISIRQLQPTAAPNQPASLHSTVDKIVIIPNSAVIDLLPSRCRNTIVVIVPIVSVLRPSIKNRSRRSSIIARILFLRRKGHGRTQIPLTERCQKAEADRYRQSTDCEYPRFSQRAKRVSKREHSHSSTSFRSSQASHA